MISENITFQYLDGDENSLWSLLLAVGYYILEFKVLNEQKEMTVQKTAEDALKQIHQKMMIKYLKIHLRAG